MAELVPPIEIKIRSFTQEELDVLDSALRRGTEQITVLRASEEIELELVMELNEQLQRAIDAEERAERAEAECLEQARLNGMGSEREAALMSRAERAEEELRYFEGMSKAERERAERSEAEANAWRANARDSGVEARKYKAEVDRLKQELGQPLEAERERDAMRGLLEEAILKLNPQLKGTVELLVRIDAALNSRPVAPAPESTNIDETNALIANDPVTLARLFHDTYERLAPEYGYETRADTKAFDPASPNGRLMTRVCAEISNTIFCPVPVNVPSTAPFDVDAELSRHFSGINGV